MSGLYVEPPKVRPPWRQLPKDEPAVALLRERGSEFIAAAVRDSGDGDGSLLRVLRSLDEGEWHLSISHPTRYPTWDEIRDARYDLLPDALTFGMLLPPRSEYVNLHNNCFHLHEVAG